jgi:alcohol dehydrogenase class IV
MTLYYGVAHGQAVGITLPEVLLLNTTSFPAERTKHFCESMKASSMEEVCERIRVMMKQSGLKLRLSELGIPADGIDVIVREGFTPERMGNNPYVFTAETLREMLQKIA